jgi:4-amino-4-deoxy-L-arabinose transferase-like glycosyltransferase
MRIALIVILALRLVLGLSYSMLNPLGEAPDEADHYAYAAYIGQQASLPIGTTITQAKHPPLYHMLAAGAASWTGMDFTFLRSNPDVGFTATAAPNFFIHTTLEDWPWRGGALAMHLGRLISVLAGLVMTAATFGLGRAMWPRRPLLALAAAAFVAFLPEGLFIGAAMSNDMLAAMFITLALWAAWRRDLFGAVLSGVAMGLAVLAKVSTVFLWPVACLIILCAPRPSRRSFGRAVLAGLIGLAIIAPWLARNWQLFGDPLGMKVVLATIDKRQVPLGGPELVALARGWFFSFWGKFGGAGQLSLPAPFYILWGVLLGVAGAGWLRWITRYRRSRQGLLAETPPVDIAILVGAPVLAVISILTYSQIALGTDQGRLLFPALAPLSLLIAGGLAAWVPPQRASLALGIWSGLLAALAVIALIIGIVLPFAPPHPVVAQPSQALPLQAVYGPGLCLLAVQPSLADGGLTLYWQARAPITQDLRAALRLLDRDGHLLWEWKRSPGAGRFSTDRWATGEVMADTYRLPPQQLAQTARVELGVYAFPNGQWLLPSNSQGGEFLTLPVEIKR